MPSNRKVWSGRVYLGRDANGKQIMHWIGRFDLKRDRDAAVALARVEKPWVKPPTSETVGDELADRYLAEYGEKHKHSSYDTTMRRLKAFRREFGARPVLSIGRTEAKDWARTVDPSSLSPVGAMFAWAINEEEIDGLERNPFRGLSTGFGRRTGRAEENPPTLDELERLRAACDVLGDDLGPRLRDMLDFAALSLMRPGEIFELRHDDIDLDRNRIVVSRRLYRGRIDVPKNGSAKTIALVPPAREILLRQPTRTWICDGGLVFVSHAGRRMCAQTLSRYWQRVCASAGLDFDFYLATRHYGISRLYRLGLSERAIAAQAGWSTRSVEKMLDVYSHRSNTILDEVQALYQREGMPQS